MSMELPELLRLRSHELGALRKRVRESDHYSEQDHYTLTDYTTAHTPCDSDKCVCESVCAIRIHVEPTHDRRSKLSDRDR